MGGAPTIGGIFSQRVVIGVGDLGASNNNSVTLSTYALGSCVAVAVYDPYSKAAAMLHVMLPDSTISPEKAQAQPAMFVDTGLPLLFTALQGIKGDPSRYRIFLAGGAAVYTGADNFKIGERNIRAIQSWLTSKRYTVSASAVGGHINRTVHLNVGTGGISLKTPIVTEKFSLAA